ncbi:MAG: tetratricopeptide repeat protein [Chloroflexota bacterium]|nr:tetratricopeptide repeat protein [Chloroflexota bacterium]
MSTPRRVDTRTAAKRRAEGRRQRRELLRRFGALLVVAILVLGTVSSIIIANPSVATSPAIAVASPTVQAPTGLDNLVSTADTAAAKGDYDSAASYYRAYLAQNASNGEVHFKLGRAILKSTKPDYNDALDQLQRAVNIDPKASYAQEANTLIDQNKGKVSATVTGGSSITNTINITQTTPPKP